MEITEAMIKKSCSPTIYKRGTEYFKEGRVHLRKREDNLITAVVDGEDIYNVQVKLNDNGIEDCFCTCPYFETMNSVCKHIVAVMEQRRVEIEEGADFVDENDRIAKTLCSKYASRRYRKEQLYAKFTLHISRLVPDGASYGMSMEIGGNKLRGIENFLDSYLRGREFKFDRYSSYDPDVTEFPKYQDEIIRVLAETYESRAADSQLYMKAAYRTSFGSLAAKRILPLLSHVDFTLIFDGMTLSGIRVAEEDPDIIIDVNAGSGEINMSVSERGFALTRDGEWFLYENTIYRTSEEWRGYFMPIYNALSSQGRTQISFRGDNTIMFAAHVLPDLKNRRGVVARGIEDVIVDDTPTFDIYFDSVRNGVSAVIMANYGSIAIRLMQESAGSGKIIVRDSERESDILSSFSSFAVNDGVFSLDNDREIYMFLKNELPRLKEKARLHSSDRFAGLTISDRINIKASVKYQSGVDLLEADFESDLTYEQISGILNAVKLKKRFYRLPSGSFVDIENSREKDIFNLLDQLDFSYEDLKNSRKELPKYHALYLDAVGGIDKDESFTEYINKIKSMKPAIPPGLDGVLREYQKDGMAWLTQLSYLGLGGILADDMGLGKTLQVIAYIHGVRPKGPTLIVAPSALTYNWLGEINKFTKDASTLIIDGTKEERERLIKTVDKYMFVITSYPILRRDIALYKDIEFAYCFIDEAQHIKNAKTMNARSVKRINAVHKFALTGTPIENSLKELWSIFDFIMPGYLYTAHEFRARYETPLVKDGDSMTAQSFRERIKPFMMRRMKKDVLSELPEKIENTMYAELTPEQKKLYTAYLALARDKTIELLESGDGRGKMRILTLLMRLRQICCHPTLFDENYDKDSGKLDLLMELVKNALDAGHRILIFSQFTSMLEIIKEKLAGAKISSFYLDGHTPSYERAELSDRFNGGERDVFLISLKAGGVGLNLTGADMVIHYDPWWNPAVMDQASDRAYRIGQTKAVQVIRLATKGTIEEKILRMQENKRSLAEEIVRVNTDTLSALSNEEILALFG